MFLSYLLLLQHSNPLYFVTITHLIVNIYFYLLVLLCDSCYSALWHAVQCNCEESTNSSGGLCLSHCENSLSEVFRQWMKFRNENDMKLVFYHWT